MALLETLQYNVLNTSSGIRELHYTLRLETARTVQGGPVALDWARVGAPSARLVFYFNSEHLFFLNIDH